LKCNRYVKDTARIESLEAEGMTTSDAQGVIEAENLTNEQEAFDTIQ